MAVHARVDVFHEIFPTRPALRRLFEYTIGQGTHPRTNDRPPSDSERDAHGEQCDETQQNHKRRLQETFHDRSWKCLIFRLDFGNSARMPPARKRCDQPDLYDFQGQILRNHSLAEGKDVAVVVLPSEPGRLEAPAKRAAYTAHLVGYDGFPITRSAKHNPALNFTPRYCLRRGANKQRIVHRLFAEGAEVAHFVA